MNKKRPCETRRLGLPAMEKATETDVEGLAETGTV
jgi:hypothetical protein